MFTCKKPPLTGPIRIHTLHPGHYKAEASLHHTHTFLQSGRVDTMALLCVLTRVAEARARSKGRARFRYAVDMVRQPPGSASLSISTVRASSCVQRCLQTGEEGLA